MNVRLLVCGLAIWLAATLVLRVAGQYLLQSNRWTWVVILFAASFPLMAFLARWLCSRFQLRREQWLAGGVSLSLPTLVLDPFSSAFFPDVFPNIAPEMSGVFGGWMLVCCAGALVGVLVRPGN
jgi:MFS family permease